MRGTCLGLVAACALGAQSPRVSVGMSLLMGERWGRESESESSGWLGSTEHQQSAFTRTLGGFAHLSWPNGLGLRVRAEATLAPLAMQNEAEVRLERGGYVSNTSRKQALALGLGLDGVYSFRWNRHQGIYIFVGGGREFWNPGLTQDLIWSDDLTVKVGNPGGFLSTRYSHRQLENEGAWARTWGIGYQTGGISFEFRVVGSSVVLPQFDVAMAQSGYARRVRFADNRMIVGMNFLF